MKKIKYLFLPLVALLITAVSCDTGTLLPNSSGASYEVLVVMEDKQWKGEAGTALFDVLSANTPGVAQAENMFRISRVNAANFTNSIRIARNVIIVDISEKYSKPKIALKKNVWSKTQAVVVINAPDEKSFIETLESHHEMITDYLVSIEHERQVGYNKKAHNVAATQKVKEMFGAELYIPKNLTTFTEKEDFFWASNMSVDIRQDIIMYSYPYTDPNTFTKEFLLQKRDSVLKYNLPGPKEGSYMATEYNGLEPIFKATTQNGRYCAETRGWWRVEGDMMGGPFISHTMLDEENQRVVTIEAFVYAPGFQKRNYIRQMEAVVYSMKLAQDIKNQDTQTENK